MNIVKRIFHRCKNHLEGPIHVWSNDNVDNKITWKNYTCNICGRYYTTSGKGLYQIPYWDSTPVHKHKMIYETNLSKDH